MGYTANDNVRQKFTSKERDNETGLDYFGERYYASTLGRFTTADPLGASARRIDPQTMNRYSYALNNPIRYIDPDGLDSWDALTKKEQELIGQKLVLQKGQTHRDAFNQLVAVKGDAKATTANIQSVQAFPWCGRKNRCLEGNHECCSRRTKRRERPRRFVHKHNWCKC